VDLIRDSNVNSGFWGYSAWDTLSLVPAGVVPDRWRADVDTIPVNRSFMHLHLGFDATGLEDLELHHIVVNSWEGGVDTEQVRPDPLLVPFRSGLRKKGVSCGRLVLVEA
jgi:hypothetical protein